MSTIDKILVIVGPTSSGKSELAVKLAKRFKGEIISADSRQVYRDMNLGTGKVEGKWKFCKNRGRGFYKTKVYVYKNTPHYLIDFANPKKQYSVSQFQKQAKKTIADIFKRGRLPIICGGTGHFIDAVVYNQNLPEVPPNPTLRKELDKQSNEQLLEYLKQLDPDRASVIDWHNKRRLIRALEIIITTGKPVPPVGADTIRPLQYDVLWLGINLPQDDLYKKIDKRLKQRLKAGMIKEVQKLRKQGLSWKRLDDFGLEYRYISLYLQKKLSYDEMFTQLSYAIKHYSKRQLTWWKRNKEINWISNYKQAAGTVAKFFK